jgi:endonuclease YncB( thermonuclease family)
MVKKTVLVMLTFLIIGLCVGSVRASGLNIDRVAVVITVFDGDTFVIDNNESIRFADVNTPEREQVGYQEAKDYVAGLVEGKTVYLDIDDKYTTDTSGNRLVAVIYVSYNSTHYLNLNKALLQNHYATIWDHDNEFNPANWNLFESKTITTPNPSPTIQEFPIFVILVLVLVPVTLLLLGLKVYGKKQNAIISFATFQ